MQYFSSRGKRNGVKICLFMYICNEKQNKSSILHRRYQAFPTSKTVSGLGPKIKEKTHFPQILFSSNH